MHYGIKAMGAMAGGVLTLLLMLTITSSQAEVSSARFMNIEHIYRTYIGKLWYI